MIDIFKDNLIKKCSFSLYTPEEIENFKILINKSTKSGFGSIYDLRLGAMDDKACLTCKQTVLKCPGHFGYIKLTSPILHPLFINRINQILQLICTSCYHCIFSQTLFIQELPKKGRFEYLYNKLRKTNYCSNCMMEQKVITYNPEIGFATLTTGTNGEQTEYYLTPAEIYFILSNIPESELNFMSVGISPKSLVIFNLTVLPNPVRPLLYNKELICDDDLTLQYIEIIRHNNELAEMIEQQQSKELISAQINNIQNRISIMFNNSSTSARHNVNMRPYKSIYERISGKGGQIRQNGVSKRADKTARTVISPNPFLTLEELGIPRIVADEITIPENVFHANLKKVQQEWRDNKIKVICKKGSDFKIDATKYKKKFPDLNIEIGDTYWRSLQDGDWVFFNRQPTLHAPSMQAMRIKIYDHKTFSFNLSNCPVYNADMDGDEMNMHGPQTWGARVEMSEISSPKNWLISQATGNADFGLMQDGLLGAYLMTHSPHSLSKSDFCQLAIQCRFLKEDRLAQFLAEIGITFNTIDLLNVLFPPDFDYSSKNITIRDGKIVSGVLVKSEIGFGASGLLPAFYNKYGAEALIAFLSDLQFICVAWLTNYSSHSIGLRDCITLTTKHEDNQRRTSFIQNITSLLEKKQHDKIDNLLEAFKNESGLIIKDRIECNNAIVPLVECGSKGNWVNLINIVGIVGQQYIKGEKVQVLEQHQQHQQRQQHQHQQQLHQQHQQHQQHQKHQQQLHQQHQQHQQQHPDMGKNFLEANGFIFSNYFNGLNYIEYFGQSIASRDAICKTATGTSVSGYLNRKLTKACENLTVNYDGTIRNGKQIITWSAF